MRYLLPAVASAAALSVGIAPAAAKNSHHHQDPPRRVASHVSLHLSRHSLLRGEGVVAHGRVRPGGSRRVKVIFRGGGNDLASIQTRPNGSFSLRWTPARTGTYSVRAFGVHDRHAKGAASAVRRATAYRPAEASYYGPGLYGSGVACGGTLEPGTLGVANRTLPCGTEVKLRYRGHTVTVPVIDRGPYVAGREFDLTTATKERLRFPGLGTVLSSR